MAAMVNNIHVQYEDQMESIGQQILDEIIYQGMVRVSHPDPKEDHVFSWNGNAVDQLDAVVRDYMLPILFCLQVLIDNPDDHEARGAAQEELNKWI